MIAGNIRHNDKRSVMQDLLVKLERRCRLLVDRAMLIAVRGGCRWRRAVYYFLRLISASATLDLLAALSFPYQT
jgi:hypothetical protein